MTAIILNTMSTGGLIVLAISIPIIVYFAMRERKKNDNG